MALLKGTNLKWGANVDGIGGFTGAVASGYTFTGADYARAADMSEIKDGDGEITSVYVYNGTETLSIKAYFSGANADITSIPAVGEVVTITSSNDSNLAGNWLVEGVSKALANESHVTFDLSLKAYDGITLS